MNTILLYIYEISKPRGRKNLGKNRYSICLSLSPLYLVEYN